MFRAGCLPPTYTLPRACFGKARTPKEARRAAPRLGSYGQDNNVRGVPPLCIVFLDFPSARLIAAERRQKVVRSAKRSLTSRVSHIFRAGCRSAIYALPRIYFGQARTPKEGRTACPTLCFYIQDNNVHGGVPCVPPLCIVFLDFRSRSARGRSATFKWSLSRQSHPSLP